MPRPKRSIRSAVTIDGHSLIWNLHREQQMETDDGWKGISIHVRNAVGVRRELHMEYPIQITQKAAFMRTTPPSRPTIVTGKVLAHIRLAMEAGWDPESRGQPFIYEAEEMPG